MSYWKQAKKSWCPLLKGPGDYEDDAWAMFLEEREWMGDFAYKREGEDCPRGTRGASVLDFETPSYHIVTLAKEGLAQALDGMADLEDKHRAALRSSVAICNVDGSIDDECAPLTMTIKARIYSQGLPCSIEVRHEYHKRQGWEHPEYSQAVSWRLNQPGECGRRFMPTYKRDEEGWRTMFYSYLDFCRAPAGAAAANSQGRTNHGRRRGGRGAGRGRLNASMRGSLAVSRETSLAGGPESDGNATDDAVGQLEAEGGLRLSSMANVVPVLEGIKGEEGVSGGEAGTSSAGMAPEGVIVADGAHTQGGGASNSSSPRGPQPALGGRSSAIAASITGLATHNAACSFGVNDASDGAQIGQRQQNGQGHKDGKAGADGLQENAQRQPSTIIRQKWLMNSDDLQHVQDHLTANSDLEDELADGDLLDLLLASVGILNCKVGEVEVGKPMYGRSFLEHHKRRLCGSTGGARSAMAASQAASEASDEEHLHSAPLREQERLQQQERAAAAAAAAKATAERSKRELASGAASMSSRRRKRKRASASAPPSGAGMQQQQQQQEQQQAEEEPPQQTQKLQLPPLQSCAPLEQQPQQPCVGYMQQGLAQHPQLQVQHPQISQAYYQHQQMLHYIAHQQMLHAYMLHQHQQGQQPGLHPHALSTPRSVFTQGPVVLQEQASPTSIFSQHLLHHQLPPHNSTGSGLPASRGPSAGRSSAPPALSASLAEQNSSQSSTQPHMLGPMSFTSTTTNAHPVGKPPLATPARPGVIAPKLSAPATPAAQAMSPALGVPATGIPARWSMHVAWAQPQNIGGFRQDVGSSSVGMGASSAPDRP